MGRQIRGGFQASFRPWGGIGLTFVRVDFSLIVHCFTRGVVSVGRQKRDGCHAVGRPCCRQDIGRYGVGGRGKEHGGSRGRAIKGVFCVKVGRVTSIF